MIASDYCVVSLVGEYDMANAHVLQEQLQRTYHEPLLIIDFTYVRYFDSSAIGVLFHKRRARAAHRFPPAVLVGLSPNVRRIFELVGMNEIWPFADNIEEALALLERER